MIPMIAGFVFGHRKASRAANLATVAGHMDTGAANNLEDLGSRVDRLVLIIEALWSLLKEQGMTDAQLAARIEELDAADGTADGHRHPPPVVCGKCGSKVSAGLPKCQICGTDTGATPTVFQRV
jgi:hypothetical protein